MKLISRGNSILLVLFLCLTLRVQGHAILLQSTPLANQVVDGKDIPIELQFNSRVDVKRSRLSLRCPNGQERDLAIEQSSSAWVVSRIKDLDPGSYVLRWQVLAEDGHISQGELLFRAK